ncbi:serine/threonine protein kinase [Vibrio anguillarum]|uniref:serine/threonine-protein kinase n=1 Tax=Vibrio anguillarum TaxID=55601 RepID=UPI00097E2DA4|nr:serine/threonine-protein kinase [Vibrio anguillarum]MBT2946375.1 serine/threonine protein kinase [Vibrio anguillarum]
MLSIVNYKFTTVEPLGEGGFGFVEKIELVKNYKEGEQPKQYARKVLAPKNDLKMFKERFKREVVSQNKCKHKYVVDIYLADLDCDSPYFIMELADCDLADLIKANELSEQDKLDVMIMTCKGLQHIHKKGYLHRDIKPFNILKFSHDKYIQLNGEVTPDVFYKISDFGLIRKTDPDPASEVLTSFGTILGTTRYCAPELMYSGIYTHQTDIFALGRVFEELNVQDERLQKIIAKCTDLQARTRYTNIEHVLEDITNVVEAVE